MVQLFLPSNFTAWKVSIVTVSTIQLRLKTVVGWALDSLTVIRQINTDHTVRLSDRWWSIIHLICSFITELHKHDVCVIERETNIILKR